MDSRQRVALALDHKQPDRVPIDYWGTTLVTSRLLDHFGFGGREELLQHLDVDFRYLEGPKYIGPEPEVHEDGSVDDHDARRKTRRKTQTFVGQNGPDRLIHGVNSTPLVACSAAIARTYGEERP